MRPTLKPGDFVLVNTWAYAWRPPSKGELVVLRSPEEPGRFLVKRVATVLASGGVVVVGDNAERSRDSRHFGPVARRNVVGRIVGRSRA
jgi:signal peptidase I